jgi:hypothetical protein
MFTTLFDAKVTSGNAQMKRATRKIDNLIAIGNRTAHIDQSWRIFKGNNLVPRTLRSLQAST